MDGMRAAAEASKAWPFEEARRLLERFRDGPPAKGHVLFETGYGPSGLPHIGTFGEVARTTMIRRAFETISDIPTRLICFSDDMDGMRKVPDNVPNQEMLRANLQRPLTSVPDPFGEHESFGAHNNAMLRRFLDTFGFEYEFVSATDFYRSGRFDAVLRRAAERYDALMEVMLASLREERQQTYSIFLPISPQSGRVLYVPLKEVNAAEGTDHLRRRGRHRDDAAGHRRQREAAVEARLRRALGGARRRLRDVRQGPFDQHADLRLDLRDPRRAGAEPLRLRAVPRREGREDLEVEGQRPDHRRVAALRRPGEPRPTSCTRSRRPRSGSTSTSSPRRSTSTTSSSAPSPARTPRRGSPTRSGTSTAGSRRRPTWWSASRCC